MVVVVGACRSFDRPMPPHDGVSQEVDAWALSVLVEARAPRMVLVDVWATWCAPCVEELPRMIELDRERDDLDVVFVSADLRAARPEACRTLADLGVSGPYLFQGGSEQAFIDALNPEWSGALPARFLYRGTRQFEFWEGPWDYGSLRAVLMGHLEDSRAQGD